MASSRSGTEEPEEFGALEGRPLDDAGSSTGANYEFQYQVAARHCCDMMSPDGPDWVLCEWHTDYVIGRGAHGVVLVSVKHRDRQRGGWTIARLCSDAGKLPSLRTRWQQCGRPAECRFVTNAHLAGSAVKLAQACRSKDYKAQARFPVMRRIALVVARRGSWLTSLPCCALSRHCPIRRRSDLQMSKLICGQFLVISACMRSTRGKHTI